MRQLWPPDLIDWSDNCGLGAAPFLYNPAIGELLKSGRIARKGAGYVTLKPVKKKA